MLDNEMILFDCLEEKAHPFDLGREILSISIRTQFNSIPISENV